METGMEKCENGFVIDYPKMFDDPFVILDSDAVADDDEEEEVMIFTMNFQKSSYSRNRLKNGWPTVESALMEHGISCSLNLNKCYMSISTTRALLDPDIFNKAMDLLRLLSVDYSPKLSIKILDDNPFTTKIIAIGFQEDGMCSKFGVKEEQFLEQIKKLRVDIPNVQGIAKLLRCYITVCDANVIVIGSMQAIKYVRGVLKEFIVHKRHLAYYVKCLQSLNMKQLEKKLDGLRI